MLDDLPKSYDKLTKRRIKTAYGRVVSDHFATVAQQLANPDWLDDANRYRRDCVGTYERDMLANPPSVSEVDLRAYVAASAPTHAIDGWSFLGRAVDCVLRSDSYSAIHLAYYAELRAAMSLLASHGIGTFSQCHCFLSKERCSHFGRPDKKRQRIVGADSTHRFIWQALLHWSRGSAAGSFVDEFLQPGGRTLRAWLKACDADIPVKFIAQSMFESWGVDLAELDEDRALRNRASYRPSEFDRPTGLQPETIVQFVRDLWACFEPSGDGRFGVLETSFLVRSLRLGNVQEVREQHLNKLEMSLSESATWLNRLAALDVPMVLTEAEVVSDISADRCAIQVASRAALLLAVATAAARIHLNRAGFGRTELQFFWNRHGIDRGLWDNQNRPTRLVDLWADVKVNIEDASDWLDKNSGSPISLERLRNSLPRGMEKLGAFELVALWGLVP